MESGREAVIPLKEIDVCKIMKCDKQEQIYNLQFKIDKAIEYIENNIWEDEYGGDVIEDYNHELLKILKEDE